jgi:hypothetical protein
LAFLSSLTILALFDDLIIWEANLGWVMDQVTAVTRPLAEIMFGWIDDLTGIALPSWLNDYLLIGSIAYSSYLQNWRDTVRRERRKPTVSTPE